MDGIEQDRAQLIEKIDNYSSWVSIESDLHYTQVRSINWMCYKWTVGARCAHTQADLEYINHTVDLSMAHAGKTKG